MAKLTLTDLSNLNNQTTAVNTVNQNNEAIEAAMEKTLSRDGTSPNEMNALLDMNSNRIINLPFPTSDTEPVRRQEISDILNVYEDLAGALEAANEAAQDAENAAALAITAAAQSNLADGIWANDVPTLVADTSLTYTPGQPTSVVAGNYIRTKSEGFSYTVAASDATDEHLTTAGGVKLYVNPDSKGARSVLAFGAVGDGVEDDTDAIQTLATLGGYIILPDGFDFRITDEIVFAANTYISGHGARVIIDQDPYVRAFRLGSHSTVDGVTFVGTGTDTEIAEELLGGQMGLAVASFGTVDVKAKNCKFYDFVAIGINQGGGLIQFSNCYGMSVDGNYFDTSNDGFVDIDASYTAGECTFIGNKSFSNSDIFIFISTVGGYLTDLDVSSVSHHIIANNIHAKNRWGTQPEGRARGRHGVVAHYNVGESYLSLVGNVIGNLARHGAYLRGPSSIVDNYCGPDLVIGNTFRHCGLGDPDDSNYCSGIRCESNRGLTIMGNVFEKNGYTPEGDAGTSPAYDIECVRGSIDLTIANNILRDALTGSVYLAMSITSRKLANVKVVNNTIRNAGFGVAIASLISGSGISDIKVIGNHITLTGATYGGGTRAAGVFTEGSGSDHQEFSIEILDNTFVGTGKTADQYGVCVMSSSTPLGSTTRIEGNTFKNLEVGIASFRFTTNGVSYASHRTIGTTTLWDNNRFLSCGSAYYIPKAVSTVLAAVGPNNLYSDTSGGLPSTSITWDVPVIGQINGRDASGNTTLKLQLAAAPSAQQWYVGDEVRLTPTAGGSFGTVCTTAGTPGTWKAYGTIAS